MRKNILLWINFLLVLFLLSACDGLKKSFGSSADNKSYAESIIGIHQEEEGNKLILLGVKHNYTLINETEIYELLKNQKLLDLNPENLRFNIFVKEYQSSDISLTIFAHFEVSKLSSEQKTWLDEQGYPIELRANLGTKKTEPKPEPVPTYIIYIERKGQREVKETSSNMIALNPPIDFEVNEYISR